MTQAVTLLGATGSIGASTLDVIARHPDRYRVFALSAHRAADALLALCLRHAPRYAVLSGLGEDAGLRRRYAAELALLPPGAPARAGMAATYEALRSRGHDVPSALRVLRQLVMERLVVLDCDRQAPLATITGAVTELAEFALDTACRQAFAELDPIHGAPLTADELAARLEIKGRERRAFDAALAELERAGEIMQNRTGALLVAKRIALVAGRIEGHPDGHGFLVPDDGGPSVFLPPAEMREVIHGTARRCA